MHLRLFAMAKVPSVNLCHRRNRLEPRQPDHDGKGRFFNHPIAYVPKKLPVDWFNNWD